jgi:two-component system, cell cycle response regulator
MRPEPSDDLARKLLVLRQRYLEMLTETLVVIENGLRACDGPDLSPEHRETIRACGHRLAGTGATYGFPAISLTGRAVDDLLKANPLAPASRIKERLDRLYHACADALSEGQAVEKPLATQALARTEFGRRAPAPEAEAVAPRPRPHRLPILLAADDDEAILSLFEQLFVGRFEVITAHNSDEALRMMRLCRPNIVLLDDIMPDSVTGLKLLELLQKTGEFAHTPIIMVTASDADADIERGLKAGARGYITKPFDPQKVAQKVEAILAAA